jgi:hypothetical protein
MSPGSKLPTPTGKFAVSCTNISQFLGSMQIKTDGTLLVPEDSGEKKNESTLTVESYYTEKPSIIIANSKHKQNLRTYLLAPWSRVLLEKLTGLQLVKKVPM